jgi:adenosylcobyric acid synthase
VVSLDGIDLVILPGSKNVRGDLEWLNVTGWSDEVKRYAGDGGSVCGICGGYQMLGGVIDDPSGVEGEPGKSEGLGLLDLTTVLAKQKRLGRVTARFNARNARGATAAAVGAADAVGAAGALASGYEIHMGKTKLGENVKPLFDLSENGKVLGSDGAVSENGNVYGTYLHGLFDEWSSRAHFLEKFGAVGSESVDNSEYKDRQYDLLAEHFRKHLDMESLFRIAGVELKSAKGEG